MKLGKFEVITNANLESMLFSEGYCKAILDTLDGITTDLHIGLFEALKTPSKCHCSKDCEFVLLVKLQNIVWLDSACSKDCCVNFLAILQGYLSIKASSQLAGYFANLISLFLQELQTNVEMLKQFEVFYPPEAKEFFDTLEFTGKLTYILQGLDANNAQTSLYSALVTNAKCVCGRPSTDTVMFQLFKFVTLEPVCSAFCIRKFFKTTQENLEGAIPKSLLETLKKDHEKLLQAYTDRERNKN